MTATRTEPLVGLTDQQVQAAYTAIFQGATAADAAAEMNVPVDVLFAATVRWSEHQRARYSSRSASHGRRLGIRTRERADVFEAFRSAGVDLSAGIKAGAL